MTTRTISVEVDETVRLENNPRLGEALQTISSKAFLSDTALLSAPVNQPVASDDAARKESLKREERDYASKGDTSVLTLTEAPD